MASEKAIRGVGSKGLVMSHNYQVKVSEPTSKQARRNRRTIRNTALASLICLVTSIGLTLALRRTQGSDAAPILFLVVIGVIANRFGTTGGILGLLVGT